MRKVDKDSPIPLYYQLKNIICELIENEELKPDDLIPTERELCEIHGVSRMTVNKAIVSLVNEGLVYRERGRGTFVVRKKEKHRIYNLLGFTEDMRQRGIEIETKLISFTRKQATKKIQQELQLRGRTDVFEITRLRYASGEAFALETAYIPAYLCETLQAGMLEQQSLYGVLGDHFDLHVEYAYQTIEPVLVTEYESELLAVKPNSLALLFSRRTYLPNDIPVEVTKAIYRSDRYKFEITLRR